MIGADLKDLGGILERAFGEGVWRAILEILRVN